MQSSFYISSKFISNEKDPAEKYTGHRLSNSQIKKIRVRFQDPEYKWRILKFVTEPGGHF